MSKADYQRKWVQSLPIKICLGCNRLKKIYAQAKQLCEYCRYKSYHQAYVKRHRTLYNESKFRWMRKAGKSSSYYEHQRNFGGIREEIIKRDGESCVICKITRTEHFAKVGIDLSVDHIHGKGRYDILGGRRNNPENLQTLCSSCHLKKGIRTGQLVPHRKS